MKLIDILKDIEYEASSGFQDVEINDICLHSKNVKNNSIFIAVKGFKKDGNDYVRDAAEKGAVALLLQKKQALKKDIPQIIVSDTRKVTPIIARNFFGDPTRTMHITGVTGTNGKTTTVFIIDSILRANSFKTSMITTVYSSICNEKVQFNRTTPESIDLNKFFFESRLHGADHASMEVSSHAIDLSRVDYIKFKSFVFTNLTQDHLDYHLNMESYFNVKKKLFTKEQRSLYQAEFAIINADDKYGKILIKDTDLKVITFSIRSRNASIFAYNIVNEISGIRMDVKIKKYESIKIQSNLCGFFNVYNILAAIGAGLSEGIGLETIKKGIKDMKGVKGRFEKIESRADFTVIVDYAHTPDGIENVLTTARSLLKKDAKLVTVFGCGGDRDKEKRRQMGKIAAKNADRVILTSDNPRSENPQLIIKMIEKGVLDIKDKIYDKIIDRKEAIIKALSEAAENDIVLIAGKGHEDYQEFADYRTHFSDQEIVEQWFIKRGLL